MENHKDNNSQGHDVAKMSVFIPSKLDDYRLIPSVFRVYCHIARRDGANGAWASVASIAYVCRVHPQTVRGALRFLVTKGFLTRTPRRGSTTVYRLTSMSVWQDPR
jgi:DNA-binding MarR family transcriptional regulator